jgi:hypothetical protein
MTSRRAIVALVTIAFCVVAMTPASAVGLGERCGGYVGIKCDAGLWCQRQPRRCSATDASGTCARIQRACARSHLPVCGCDGKTYANDCEPLWRGPAFARRACSGDGFFLLEKPYALKPCATPT